MQVELLQSYISCGYLLVQRTLLHLKQLSTSRRVERKNGNWNTIPFLYKYLRKYSFRYVQLTLLTRSLILKYFLNTNLSIEMSLVGTISVPQAP